jgi:hypothetical protein
MYMHHSAVRVLFALLRHKPNLDIVATRDGVTEDIRTWCTRYDGAFRHNPGFQWMNYITPFIEGQSSSPPVPWLSPHYDDHPYIIGLRRKQPSSSASSTTTSSTTDGKDHKEGEDDSLAPYAPDNWAEISDALPLTRYRLAQNVVAAAAAAASRKQVKIFRHGPSAIDDDGNHANAPIADTTTSSSSSATTTTTITAIGDDDEDDDEEEGDEDEDEN